MADLQTYVPIATQTLGSAATSLTFSSIPSTYTDLVLIANSTIGSGDGCLLLQFNSDTSTNYSATFLYGFGSTTISSGRTVNATSVVCGRTGTSQSISTVHLNNYSNSSYAKTVISRGSNPASIVFASTGLWRGTAVINSITISNEAAVNFLSGSIFTLYGIKAA